MYRQQFKRSAIKIYFVRLICFNYVFRINPLYLSGNFSVHKKTGSNNHRFYTINY